MSDTCMEPKDYHALGVRDGIAYVLAESYGQKIKLRNLAEEYEKRYGSKHFSHEFHVSEK